MGVCVCVCVWGGGGELRGRSVAYRGFCLQQGMTGIDFCTFCLKAGLNLNLNEILRG